MYFQALVVSAMCYITLAINVTHNMIFASNVNFDINIDYLTFRILFIFI